MTPDIWFSVTDWTQFALLLPIGLLFGFVAFPYSPTIGLGRRALMYGETVFVFWAFLLAIRAFSGRVPWQASIGTATLNLMFVVAIYLGRKLRDRV